MKLEYTLLQPWMEVMHGQVLHKRTVINCPLFFSYRLQEARMNAAPLCSVGKG